MLRTVSDRRETEAFATITFYRGEKEDVMSIQTSRGTLTLLRIGGLVIGVTLGELCPVDS